MVIHTKEKPKLHLHESKKAEIKASNIYTVSRGPKVQETLYKVHSTKQNKKMKFRRNTTHPKKPVKTKKFKGSRKDTEYTKESKQPIKSNKRSIKLAGATGAKVITDQMEGGEEVQQAIYIAYGGSRFAMGTTSKGADLLKSKIFYEKKRRLKVVDSAKKSQSKKIAKSVTKSFAKKTVKDAAKENTKVAAKIGAQVAGTTAGTATTGVAGPIIGMAAGKVVGDKLDKMDLASYNRNRKLKFFMDKMKSQENQNDNILKVVRDLVSRQAMLVMKTITTSIVGFLLSLFLLIAIAALPVIAFVAIIYNSPFAIFFPPLEEGDTVMSVTSEYEADFNRTVTTLANEHNGCDSGEVVYVDYEGTAAVPSNYYDVIAVYMVKYGVGDTATIMNDTTKSRLRAVFDDMCTYYTSTETKTETIENEDGTTTTTATTILKVNVSLKSYQDMISEYGFSSDEVEMLEDLMNPEYLTMIGYTGVTGGGSSGGGNPVSELSASEITAIVSEISDPKAKQTVSFALSKVGYPYSQDYRDSGNYYDCSSLAYYSWKSAGVNISFGGATTAASEGQGLDAAGKTVSYDGMQPGDLIFYSYLNNGRYKNISHVAIYAGNGKVVEAANENIGVVYRDVPNPGSIVMIGRP